MLNKYVLYAKIIEIIKFLTADYNKKCQKIKFTNLLFPLSNGFSAKLKFINNYLYSYNKQK